MKTCVKRNAPEFREEWYLLGLNPSEGITI